MGGSEPNPGLLIEMVQRAAQKQSYSVMQKIVPWARAIRMARTEANALIAGYTRLPSRENNHTWTVKQMALKSAFISLDRRVDTFEEAKQLSAISVRRATFYEVELEERGFENIRTFNRPDQLLKYLERGRIDAWFGSNLEFSKRIDLIVSEKWARIIIGKPVIVEELWLAGSKQLSPKIVKDLYDGTRFLIQGGERDRLIAKYFGEAPS